MKKEEDFPEGFSKVTLSIIITAIHFDYLLSISCQLYTSSSYVLRANDAPVSCTKIQPCTQTIWIRTGVADKDPEFCEADLCSIDEAPTTMKAIRWLGCDSCNKWYMTDLMTLYIHTCMCNIGLSQVLLFCVIMVFLCSIIMYKLYYVSIGTAIASCETLSLWAVQHKDSMYTMPLVWACEQVNTALCDTYSLSMWTLHSALVWACEHVNTTPYV